MNEPAPLPYAKRPPWHQRLPLVKYAVLAALLLAAITWGWWSPKPVRHVQLLLHQRACLSYAAPVDQVVFEPHQTSLVAAPWQAFYGAYSPPGVMSLGTVFLHERSSPGGERMLVAVDLTSTPTAGQVALFPRVFSVGTLFSSPRQLLLSVKAEAPILEGVSRVYAGQADPTDTSHFTIDYEDAGGRHTIDGWLLPGPQIRFESR